MATKDFSFTSDKILGNALDDQFNNLNLNQNDKSIDSDLNTIKNGTSKTFDNLAFFKNAEKENLIVEKDSSVNNSTLSLHIAAYENSSDSDGKKEEERGSKIKKQLKEVFPGFIQYRYDIPRQQENQKNESEMMQFKASQKLLDPNQAAIRTSSSSSLGTTSKSVSSTSTAIPGTFKHIRTREYFFNDEEKVAIDTENTECSQILLLPQTPSRSNSDEESSRGIVQPGFESGSKSPATTTASSTLPKSATTTPTTTISSSSSSNPETAANSGNDDEDTRIELENRKRYEVKRIKIVFNSNKTGKIKVTQCRIGKTLQVFKFVPDGNSIFNKYLRNTDEIRSIDGVAVTSANQASTTAATAYAKRLDFFMEVNRLRSA
uniref:PDZ domain-containing protein n=1 Tax=Panagrolaimus sp. ES5 TaxID=591445 RepID=A0AC34GS99_9BILA